MAVIVERIVVTVDEVPADQVVAIPVAILIGAVLPTAIVQQIAGVDTAILVHIRDVRAVRRSVQVTEGDQPIRIDVSEAVTEREGDLALIEPDVQVEIDVGVVDARIDDTNDGLGRTREAGRPGLSSLAAIDVLHRGRVTVHPPETAAGVGRVVACCCKRHFIVRLGEGDARLLRQHSRGIGRSKIRADTDPEKGATLLFSGRLADHLENVRSHGSEGMPQILLARYRDELHQDVRRGFEGVFEREAAEHALSEQQTVHAQKTVLLS